MKIPDYKKRAALAAENWKRLQAQKKIDSKETNESDLVEDQSLEPTFDELIDEFVIPRTSIKGIRISKDKKELRDIA